MLLCELACHIFFIYGWIDTLYMYTVRKSSTVVGAVFGTSVDFFQWAIRNNGSFSAEEKKICRVNELIFSQMQLINFITSMLVLYFHHMFNWTTLLI